MGKKASPPVPPDPPADTAPALAPADVPEPPPPLPPAVNKKDFVDYAQLNERQVEAADDAKHEDLGHLKLSKGTRARTDTQLHTLRKQVIFLREYALCGIVLKAAQAAGVGRRCVYYWCENPAFERLMAEARDDALDALEEEARRRASDGVIEPVFQGGHKVGEVRKYSDHLLMMILKGKRRAEFSERTETTGPNGSPLAPAVVLVSWHQGMKPIEQP